MADLDASTEAAELDARGMTALAAGKARPVALRAFTLAAGAALSLGALYAGGTPYAGYEVHYGRFGWGPFELAFLVNYLVFGTIAIALGGAAIALGGGPRLAAAVDGLGRLAPTCVRAVVLVALAALAVLITTTRLFLLRDTAITDDEHVYAFMARVFAAGKGSGRLAARADPRVLRQPVHREQREVVRDVLPRPRLPARRR